MEHQSEQDDAQPRCGLRLVVSHRYQTVSWPVDRPLYQAELTFIPFLDIQNNYFGYLENNFGYLKKYFQYP